MLKLGKAAGHFWKAKIAEDEERRQKREQRKREAEAALSASHDANSDSGTPSTVCGAGGAMLIGDDTPMDSENMPSGLDDEGSEMCGQLDSECSFTSDSASPERKSRHRKRGGHKSHASSTVSGSRRVGSRTGSRAGSRAGSRTASPSRSVSAGNRGSLELTDDLMQRFAALGGSS